MFSIYGQSGQVFHGSMEDLVRVRGGSRSRTVRPIGREGAEGGALGALVRSTVARTGQPSEQAVEAYRDMLHVDLERGPLYHADQIMQPQVITVGAEAPLEQAWRLLLEHHIHQAPVLDTEHQLVGIVSERDLLTALNVEASRVGDAMARAVGDVMTSPVVSADPITDIRRIAQVMIDQGVTGVPIVNERGALVGFVTRGDILHAVVTDPPLSLWR